MNEIFPPEIITKILTYLNYIDIESAYNTCILWQNIINEYKVWQYQWMDLSKLVEISHRGIADVNIFQNKGLQTTCNTPIDMIIRLKNILYPENKKQKCFFRMCNRLQHSSALIQVNSQTAQITSFAYNSDHGDEGDYFNKISNNASIKSLFYIHNQHLHIETLIYIFSIDFIQNITKDFIKFLIEEAHANDISIIPSVLLSGYGFYKEHFINIYARTDAIEIAIIFDYKIMEKRWLTLPYSHGDIKTHKYTTKDERKMKTKRNSSFGTNCAIEEVRSRLGYPKTYFLCDEFYKKLDLANTIKYLLDELEESTKNILLQSVFLIGFQYLSFVDVKLKAELINLYPEFEGDIMVHVERTCDLVDCCRIFNSMRMDETKIKYEAGAPYSINVENYVLYGLENF